MIGSNWKSVGDINFVNYFTEKVLNKAKFNSDLMEVVFAPTDIHLDRTLCKV